MEYVSPFDERVAPTIEPAPRLSSLEGRRLVLFDISKRKSREFLEALAGELATRDGAEVVHMAKPTYSRPGPQEVIEQASGAGEAVVVALAD